MSEKPARPAQQKLPRSFNRTLGRVLALPEPEGIALTKAVHARANSPKQKVLAMRLRLRLLQEALDNRKTAPRPKAKATTKQAAKPKVVPPAPEPAPTPPTPSKTGKLTSLDPTGVAMLSMMQQLESSQENDDFFDPD